MLLELKIILYLLFVVVLFSIDNPIFYGVVFITLSLLLFLLPVKFILRGWVPISVILIFTFLSNLLSQHGNILFVVGPLIITSEGLTEATMKTVRVACMITGAKLLTGTTPVESFAEALGRILKPLRYVRVPVDEFVSTMGLTLRSLPVLKERVWCRYRHEIQRETASGFRNRLRIVAGIIMPFFLESLQKPELFFQKDDDKK